MSETMDSDIERIARAVFKATFHPSDKQETVERCWLAWPDDRAMAFEQARSLLPLIAQAKEEGAAEMRERAVKVAASWQVAANIRLWAGEMNAQEIRAAKAVAGGIEGGIRYLSLPLKEEQNNGQ